MKAQIWNYNCFLPMWGNYDKMRDTCATMLKLSGFNILQTVEHEFEPHGYTALFLLSESHFALHTFDEENKVYLEISSCNKQMFDNIYEVMVCGVLAETPRKDVL
jgi:S-adenosylmethionine decarboxylase